MDVRWVTVFVDRPAAGFDEVREFWRRVTDTTLSATRGEHGQFATFVPADGDPYLRIQRVQDGPGGTHLDLHVADPCAAAHDAIALGAQEVADHGDVVILRSPGGVVFCTVAEQVDGVPPSPAGEPGRRVQVHQVTVDLAPALFDAERGFWSRLTGWAPVAARVASFAALDQPAGVPVRFMFQRCDATAGRATRCHLDVSCDDRAATVGDHLRWGADVGAVHEHWTVMRDPSGHEYCLIGP